MLDRLPSSTGSVPLILDEYATKASDWETHNWRRKGLSDWIRVNTEKTEADRWIDRWMRTHWCQQQKQCWNNRFIINVGKQRGTLTHGRAESNFGWYSPPDIRGVDDERFCTKFETHNDDKKQHNREEEKWERGVSLEKWIRGECSSPYREKKARVSYGKHSTWTLHDTSRTFLLTKVCQQSNRRGDCPINQVPGDCQITYRCVCVWAPNRIE